MVQFTTEARGSAPAKAPPYFQHSDDSIFEDNCMLEPNRLPPRKRARSGEHTDHQREASPPAKRRKASHPSDPPPAYWDNLSKIWLTKRALRELDRRNTRAIPRTSRTSQKHSSIASGSDGVDLSSDDPRFLKAWKPFSRHRGLDLSDLRNFPEPDHITKHTMSASRSRTQSGQRDAASARNKSATNTTKTRSTGAYDRNFQQHLVDHNIYPHGYRHHDGSVPTKPTNWKDINESLRRDRDSLSPSRCNEEDYERFMQADADALKEKQVSELVIPFLEGEIADAKCRSGGIPFTNLEHLTDGTLKPGNPDIYYGARPEQLSRQVRTELARRIIPSTQHDLPMLPNFFVAAKGPDGSIAVAGRQACYDSALGARGMASLEEYGKGELCYGTANTISTIYHGGQLKMYTSHLAQPSDPGSPPQYYMTQINTWGMTGNADTYREGVRAYRNARDWAKKRRDDFIKQANERVALFEAETSINDKDAEASPALSFVTAASDTEAYTMSEESGKTLKEGSNMLGIFVESDSSVETLAASRVTAKQSTKRKRRSTNVESDAQHRAD